VFGKVLVDELALHILWNIGPGLGFGAVPRLLRTGIDDLADFVCDDAAGNPK